MLKIVHELKCSKQFYKPLCLARKRERIELWNKLWNKSQAHLQSLIRDNLDQDTVANYYHSTEQIHRALI